MAKTKLGKRADKLNEELRGKIVSEMHEKFSVEVENHFDFLSMRLLTFRVDGEDFTTEQFAYLEAFSKGFGEAMNIVKAGI